MDTRYSQLQPTFLKRKLPVSQDYLRSWCFLVLQVVLSIGGI